MDNVTNVDSDYPRNLDNLLDVRYKVVNMTVAIATLIFNAVSLIALNRTTHTPQTARFLSSALLIFDFATTFIYTVRKLITDGRYNLMVQFFAIGWSFLAYINIAIMSLERVIVFQWPNFYLRRVSFSKVWKLAVTVWLIYIGAWTVESGRCSLFFTTETNVRAWFDGVIIKYMMITFPLSTLVSCVCLTKILVIIRHQTNKVKEGKSALRSHKSTLIVFLCCLNYLVTTLIYVVIVFLTIKDNYSRRILMDVLMMVNGFLDTCVYVMWFKECRLELLKMVARCFPTLNNKVENMRLHVFDIMTYSNSSSVTP